jgi:hypothetical protein
MGTPIYQQLADERLVDVPEQLDAQALAYRGMAAADAVPDVELPALAERVHPPYVPGADVRPGSVEEHEAAGWDRGRVDPRPAR